MNISSFAFSLHLYSQHYVFHLFCYCSRSQICIFICFHILNLHYFIHNLFLDLLNLDDQIFLTILQLLQDFILHFINCLKKETFILYYFNCSSIINFSSGMDSYYTIFYYFNHCSLHYFSILVPFSISYFLSLSIFHLLFFNARANLLEINFKNSLILNSEY